MSPIQRHLLDAGNEAMGAALPSTRRALPPSPGDRGGAGPVPRGTWRDSGANSAGAPRQLGEEAMTPCTASVLMRDLRFLRSAQRLHAAEKVSSALLGWWLISAHQRLQASPRGAWLWCWLRSCCS